MSIQVNIQKKFINKGSKFDLDAAFDAANELVVLFGPSGAGKTATLHCLAGLIKPDAGTITIDDQAFFDSSARIDLSPQARRLGYVFQDYALFPHLTVAENIAFGLSRLTRWAKRAKVDEMIKLMRLDGLAASYPAQISGGQKQRVALARALVTEPKILLLDEPLSALDSAVREKLRRDLLTIKETFSLTMILVTHDLEEAYQLADRVVVFDQGKVLQVGDRDEVFFRPANRTVARFVGAKNIFTGRVGAASNGKTVIDTGRFETVVPADRKYEPDETVAFCIRPEDVMVIRPGKELGDGLKENVFRGRVVAVSHRGDSCLLQFKIEGGPDERKFDFTIKLPAHAYQKLELTKYPSVTISLKKQAIHVFGKEVNSDKS